MVNGNVSSSFLNLCKATFKQEAIFGQQCIHYISTR